ncbi:hypothetical protein FGG08_002857 [Glutinoglossum americanum]|uniref:Uncharacterized protein n=1 Tax=Glutinoglossum americanum TaxID=1670608 RepID=A0A9P8I412_9PEZI|nr:hypothetical protein FGG08_002857 [Glutinoglossum americanum]
MFRPSHRDTSGSTSGQYLLRPGGAVDGHEPNAVPESQKGWFRTALSALSRAFGFLHIVLGFLWIAPAVALLVLNHWGVILGASIGCPSCRPRNVDSQAVLNRMYKDDHNVLGALQVASKAIEVWFMFVAASLVYDVTMFMAEKRGYPIPIGFLTTYLEFGDLRYFCTPSPWTTPVRTGSTLRNSWRSALKLYGFFAFVIAMSLTANLMGPGSAVLIIPTLQYRNVSHMDGPVFKGLAMGNQPSNTNITSNCTASWLGGGNYTCFTEPYASGLDALLTDVVAGYTPESGFSSNTGLSVEQGVTLLFNLSCYPDIASNDWDCGLYSAPNRQILREISTELSNYFFNSYYGKLEPPLDNALQTAFHRTGPSVAVNVTCDFSNLSVSTVAEDKAVRCYGIFGGDLCVPVGRGWDHDNIRSSFSLGNANTTTGNVTIDSYFSEVAANLTQGVGGCGATDESCWDSKFLTKTMPNIANVTVMEFNNARLSTPDRILTCVSWYYPSVSHYKMDPSGNDINLVRIVRSSQDTTAPQKVHPDWLLAAWSTERDGTVAASSQAARVMISAIESAYVGAGEELFTEIDIFSILHQLVLAQSMSLVDYATAPLDPTTENAKPKPLTLDTWKVIYVYAYGNDSRTATMGAFVLCAGIVAALVRTGTAIARRERTKSAFDLLAIALKHQYKGEFRGKETETQRARVRIGVDRLRGHRGKEYKLRFEGEGGSGGETGGWVRGTDGGGTGGGGMGGVYWGNRGFRGEPYSAIPLTESPQMIRGGNGQQLWERQ